VQFLLAVTKLERLISKLTYYMLSDVLNSVNLFILSLTNVISSCV